VLKKAGIVVATAAAGLLAMSPLAFAGDKDDHDGHHHHHRHHGGVSIEDSEDVDVQKTVVKDNEVCNNEGQNNESKIVNVFHYLPPGTAGALEPLTNAVTQTSTPVNLQCNDIDIDLLGGEPPVVPPPAPPAPPAV
jgi:hypothetical protein